MRRPGQEEKRVFPTGEWHRLKESRTELAVTSWAKHSISLVLQSETPKLVISNITLVLKFQDFSKNLG